MLELEDMVTSADVGRRPLWDRPLPISRKAAGPVPATELAHQCFAIADAEGLHALSVKRLAGRVGIPAAQLEKYLHSKDELLDLMLDEALGEIQLPADDTAPWADQLRAIAISLREVVQRRPWLVSLMSTRPAAGPHGLRYTERALGALANAGLDVVTAAACVNGVLAFVCGFTAVNAPARRTPDADRSADLAAYVNSTVAGPDYPHLRELIGHDGQLTAQGAFEVGLDDILTGIAARL